MTDPRGLLDAHGRKNTIIAAEPGDTTCEGYWTELQDVAPKAFAALRAVLKRHCDDGGGECSECVDASLSLGAGPVSYPCPTVQDITEALEGK